MDGLEALALLALILLVIAAVAVILTLAGVGAVSGYVAGRSAPSATGRSSAIAGLAIGAVVGVLECLLFIFVGDTMWAILFLIGVLTVVVGSALFAYRRDLRTSTILVLLAVGVAVVAVLVAVATIVWLVGSFDEPVGPPLPDDSLRWQYETGNLDESVIVSPTLADGVIYAGSYQGFIYALDAETGGLLWRLDAGSVTNLPSGVTGVARPPTVAGGVVYVEKEEGGLWGLDALTGEVLWKDETVYEDLLLSDGILYIPIWQFDGDSSVNIRAVDEGSGDLKWEADVSRSSALPLLFPLAASGRNVYVSDDNQVHALDSTTGRLAWSFDAGDVVEIPPRGSDGVVYLRSYSAAYAMDESTGEPIWRYEVDAGGLGHAPSITDGVWALVDGGADVQSLDAATGQPLWSYGADRVSFVSGVSDGMVYVTGKEAFHALDAATGKEMWSLDAGWGLGEVTVVNGILYANSLDGYLHTFDARTGEPFWSVEVGYHLGGTGKPYFVSGGVVYVGYQPTTPTEGEGAPSSGVYAFTAPGG